MNDPGVEFRKHYARLVAKFRSTWPGKINDVASLHLPANVPPWTDTGLTLQRGETITILASGDVVWSRVADLLAAPRYHLWCRIGDGEIFRLGSDTRTLTVPESGRLSLCIYHGIWASRDGVLKPPTDAYGALEGGFDVLVVRWGDVSPSESLDVLSSLAPDDPLIRAERTRLGTRREPPPGFEPLWFVGRTDIFSTADVDGAPAITLRADADAGIIRKPFELPLTPGTFLEWTWRINRMPSRGREDTFATHDYTSVAVELDDGRDLTWHWSAALPVDHYYGCPLPRWKGVETHMVVRSGPAGLGTWIDERRDVHADAARALGAAPARIVAVWLIGISLFQRTIASVDVRQIAVVQDGRRHAIFPA
jgi:hypothetical protein